MHNLTYENKSAEANHVVPAKRNRTKSWLERVDNIPGNIVVVIEVYCN